MSVGIEIDDDGSFSTRMGFTLDDIAKSARQAFFSSLGKECTDWEGMGRDRQERWRDCVEVLVEVIRLQVEGAWDKMAHRMYFAFHRKDDWDGEPRVMRLAWEVAARESVNYFMAEDKDDLREIKDMDWASWAGRRLEGAKGG